jgi:hypothetical protein
VIEPSDRSVPEAYGSTPPARDHKELIGVGAVLLVAVSLRLHGLAALAWDQDELYTLFDATDLSSGGRGPGILGRPLYYLLQHFLLKVSAPTPLNLRLPAMLFGVLGVWLTWRLARRNFGPTAAVVSATLVAVSGWHLYASQLARYWTLIYCLSTATLILLPPAIDLDRPRSFLAALAVMLAGTLTHPTFVFPMVGVLLALHLVRREGQIRWRWPTPRAWVWLWGPLLASVTFGVAILKLSGHSGALQNWAGRGAAATLRIVPGMVQWLSPEVVAASAGGILLLACSDRPADRRWAAMALLGGLSAIVLLLAAASRTDVYADYGMSMLPLAFLSVGGALERARERIGALGAATAAVVITAGALPGTVAHLTDGTRFDHRPALAYVARHGPDRLVVGWPIAVVRAERPELRSEETRMSTRWLAETLRREHGYWLVATYQRTGLVGDDGTVTPWIDRQCRRRLATERTRLDFRVYRVELYWCGSGAPDENGIGEGY